MAAAALPGGRTQAVDDQIRRPPVKQRMLVDEVETVMIGVPHLVGYSAAFKGAKKWFKPMRMFVKNRDLWGFAHAVSPLGSGRARLGGRSAFYCELGWPSSGVILAVSRRLIAPWQHRLDCGTGWT